MNAAKKLFWMSGVWAPPAVVEYIVAKDFPMGYLPAPPRATQLSSKVTGAVVLRNSQDYPLTLVKEGKAGVLRSKFRS